MQNYFAKCGFDTPIEVRAEDEGSFTILTKKKL
jgi:hypothetical protein